MTESECSLETHANFGTSSKLWHKLQCRQSLREHLETAAVQVPSIRCALTRVEHTWEDVDGIGLVGRRQVLVHVFRGGPQQHAGVLALPGRCERTSSRLAAHGVRDMPGSIEDAGVLSAPSLQARTCCLTAHASQDAMRHCARCR